MPKKKCSVPKDGLVWRRSAEEATLDRMPKYNAHACGTGPHGDAKYNRAKQKRAWQKEFERQEARTCGPLPQCTEHAHVSNGRYAECSRRWEAHN